ncbi:uncharacterized protein C8R40DRAFT_123149 [Lentinula edodes]|uniref:uncharacterized protein n=1 Tax=Lentinula edodes TaxID=5353 RepID=UPI001E8D6DEF|nr:uncharacterized protein C8R40DRAFT_123149 [Lentinula edodes]KAH7867608.1 hypothetical protein C8R40DRAFT_123149 [Lentinula edodes]
MFRHVDRVLRFYQSHYDHVSPSCNFPQSKVPLRLYNSNPGKSCGALATSRYVTLSPISTLVRSHRTHGIPSHFSLSRKDESRGTAKNVLLSSTSGIFKELGENYGV